MAFSIEFKPFFHRGAGQIGIYFLKNKEIEQAVKKIKGVKWSQTNRCWYVPLDTDSYNNIYKALNGRVRFDITVLKDCCEKRNREISTIAQATIKPSVHKFQANSHVLPAMKQALVLKAYSPTTIKTYLNEVSQFLQSLKTHPADEFSASRIKNYLQYCYEKLNLSENTLHSRINALKFYYEQVLKREKFFWDIPRPKKPLILPKLLNETELRKLFNALTNKKHKAMLFTAYSSGLRVSEIVNLKIADIDSKRMQIFIQRAKGKKDRYVNLSPILLDILRKYMQEYKPRPRVYLFESEQTLSAYPTRTVQQIFSNAKRKARIGKTVGVHSLRHSFATHLLDKGTDIKYIKDLLGHFNIKTTERYLHVSKKQLVNIISPFDDLWKNEDINW